VVRVSGLRTSSLGTRSLYAKTGTMLPDEFDMDPEIEAWIAEIASQASRGTDDDWWAEAEQMARNALATALYDRELIEKVLERLKKLETKT
jgi:hypothetical protein